MAGKKQMRKRVQLYRISPSYRPRTALVMRLPFTSHVHVRLVCLCVRVCVSTVNQQATAVRKRSLAKISGQVYFRFRARLAVTLLV